MIQSEYLIENSKFIVFMEDELTSLGKKELTHLYMPLIGQMSFNIYMTLSTLLDVGKNETLPIGHLKLFQLLKITDENEFVNARHRLEAIGLLNVFQKENLYIYKLNLPLLPNEFFQHELLPRFLYQVLGDEEFNNLVIEFVIHRFDISLFKEVTVSFDDCFSLDGSQLAYLNDLKNSIATADGNQIKVNNPHFDYEYLNILLTSLDIIDSKLINNKDFYNMINKYSFLYQLTTEQIKDAIIASTTPNKDVNSEIFKKICKQIYDQKVNKPKFVPKTIASSNDKLISFLEHTAPTEIVRTKFGVGLISSEIEMFNQLMKNTGVSLGILNVLIIYVLQDKKGEVPTYNYFDKIIKTWQRMKITTTKQAIDHINGRDKEQPKPKIKGSKPLPSWFDDYSKSLENVEHKVENTDDEKLKEINDLFKFEENKNG